MKQFYDQNLHVSYDMDIPVRLLVVHSLLKKKHRSAPAFRRRFLQSREIIYDYLHVNHWVLGEERHRASETNFKQGFTNRKQSPA